MRTKRTLLATLGSFLAGAGATLAQTNSAPVDASPPAAVTSIVQNTAPQPAVQPVETPFNPVAIDRPSALIPCECDRIPRWWGSAEYLLWQFKDAPVPVPLVTTGPAVPNLSPVLGTPGTSVLLGGNNVDLGSRSGGRFTLGGWLNDARTLGLEGSYTFLLAQTMNQNVASSGAPGSPFLAIPFLNAVTGLESSTRLAAPGEFAGFGQLGLASDLQTAEINAVRNFVRGDVWMINLLAGFRYANLRERLTFSTSSPSVVPPLDVFMTQDRFDTNNNFYGGQVGARIERRMGKFFANATGKVALGNVHQSVNISGQLLSNDFNGFGVPQVFAGGYFSQPTNIGTQTADRFAVLSEFNGNVGYQLTRSVRVFAGYSFLYLSSVVRPGNQMDRRINPTQAPTILGAAALIPNPLVGPAAPLPLFNRTDFWAHGVNFGLDVRY